MPATLGLPPDLATKAQGLIKVMSLFGKKRVDKTGSAGHAIALASALGIDASSPIVSRILEVVTRVHDELAGPDNKPVTINQILSHPTFLSSLGGGEGSKETDKSQRLVHLKCPNCAVVNERSSTAPAPCGCGFKYMT